MVKANSQRRLFESQPAEVARRTLPVDRTGNDAIARLLEEIAERLTQQGASIFRAAAYRHAASTIREQAQPVQDILANEGRDGLMRLPGIGRSIGRAIERYLKTGRMPRLEQLRVASQPQRLFTTVAEIGPMLAAEIEHRLGIETLADLENAAWDGRLARVPGMGRKRIQAVRESLAGRFRSAPPQARKASQTPVVDQPPVGDLLWIDGEYRRLVELDRLPRIAPRRFNPEGKAWLPILHTECGGRRYTALYSNTARAHELGTTHDWVVIYRDDGPAGGQWTVITSKLGKLNGRRVVRGREAQCAAHYTVCGQ